MTPPSYGPTSTRRAKKSTPDAECLGRSRGGISTKIHVCTDALSLLKDLQPGKVLADTAYDSNKNRACCAEHGIEAVIPSHPNRLEPAKMDDKTYRDRNKIERFFGRFKQYRRLATRYEKPVVSFLAFWHVAVALDWLR